MCDPRSASDDNAELSAEFFADYPADFFSPMRAEFVAGFSAEVSAEFCLTSFSLKKKTEKIWH